MSDAFIFNFILSPFQVTERDERTISFVRRSPHMCNRHLDAKERADERTSVRTTRPKTEMTSLRIALKRSLEETSNCVHISKSAVSCDKVNETESQRRRTDCKRVRSDETIMKKTMVPPRRVDPVLHRLSKCRSLKDSKDSIRVVVVGGGVSGLTVAKTLVKRGIEEANLPLKITVLEARTRLGGRICTKNLRDGSRVDLGASFVHGCNVANPVYSIAKRLGVVMHTGFGGYR